MANIVILTQMKFPATIDESGVMHFVSGLLMGLPVGEMLSGMIVIGKKLMQNRAENDYKVNLKTEIMIEDLYDKVNAILAKQSQIEKLLAEEKTKGEETK